MRLPIYYVRAYLCSAPSHKMPTIHRKPTTRTRQLPSELLHKIITWVIAQSVHSICVLSDDFEWGVEVDGDAVLGVVCI